MRPEALSFNRVLRKYPLVAEHLRCRRYRDAATALLALPDHAFDDESIAAVMTMMAAGRCLDLAAQELDRLVALAADGTRLFPLLYLRLLQLDGPSGLAATHLSRLQPRHQGMRLAIEASILLHRLPQASADELRTAAGLFAAAASAPGLARVDQLAALGLARLIEPGPAPPSPAAEEVFSAHIDNAPSPSAEAVFLCAGDPSYFFAFATPYIDSVLRFCPRPAAIHFVLLDFADAEIDAATALFASYGGAPAISFSLMRRRPHVSRTFYCVARYYALPALWPSLRAGAARHVVVTDIDHVFVKPIDPLFAIERTLALGYVTADHLFPWMRFRANLLLFNFACGEARDLEAVLSILSRSFAILLAGKSFWYLDQAALAILLQRLVHCTGRDGAVADITRRYREISFQPTGDRFNAGRKLERLHAAGHGTTGVA